jgi:cytochrome c biogenesis protein ResB
MMAMKKNIPFAKAIRALGSVRMATHVIAVLLVCAVAISLVPDVDEHAHLSSYTVMNDSGELVRPIHFTDRFSSPVMLGIFGALFVGLVSSLILRLRAELRRRSSDGSSPTPGSHPDIARRIRDVLLDHRYSTSVDPTGDIRASKGRNGILGSILFHSSIAAILFGVVLTALMSFRGAVVLTEGERFSSGADEFFRANEGSLYPGYGSDIAFTLERVDAEYRVDGATTIAAIIRSEDAGETTPGVPVYINHGASVSGVEVHAGTKHGLSPAVSMDFVHLPDGETYAELHLLPDPAYRNGKFISFSDVPSNPILRVRIIRAADTLFDRVLPVEGSIFDKEFIVTFPELRRWAQLEVVDDNGSTVLLIGTLFASIGLLVRLFSVRKRITVIVNEKNGKTVVRVSGSAEKFQAEFRAELATIRSEIQLAVIQYDEEQKREVEAPEYTNVEVTA